MGRFIAHPARVRIAPPCSRICRWRHSLGLCANPTIYPVTCVGSMDGGADSRSMPSTCANARAASATESGLAAGRVPKLMRIARVVMVHFQPDLATHGSFQVSI